MTETVSSHAPGWYPDPAGSGRPRYWDGNAWGAFAVPDGPAKRSHTARNVLIVVAVLLVAAVGGCTALVAAVGQGASEAVDDFNKSLEPKVAEAVAPTTTAVGQDAGESTTSAAPATTVAVPTTVAALQGTQSNPGAAGQTFTLKDRDNGDFDVTLTSFEPDAWPAITASNQFNDAAPVGKRYVAIGVTVVYHAGERPMSGQTPLFNLGVSMFGSLGQERKTYDCSVVLDGKLDVYADLIDGGTASGLMCFMIDEAEAAGPILVRFDEDWCFTNCDEAWIKVQ